FRHALVQQTVYQDLSPGRRSRLHRRVGEVLELEYGNAPGDRIGELARHWIAATRPADVMRAAHYARRAGERALARVGPAEAIRWFEQTLELLDADPPDDPRIRLDVQILLGDAQRQAGQPSYRETLIDAAARAKTLGDRERLVAAALVNERGAFSISDVL